MVEVKPYKTYFGGKEATGVFQAIINQIPPHSTYAELFVGNGSIFRNKKKADFNILCDKSEKVVAEWEKQGIQKIDLESWDFLTAPSDFIVNECAIEVLGTSLNHDWITTMDFKDVFIYLDPPYPFTVRKQQKNVYDHELTAQDHNALLEVISSYKNAKIMISSYPNELYDEVLKDWRKVDFQGQTRQGKVTERIYMNYPEPTELHDYRYYGLNFRDRWRIKKSIKNIVGKFNRLPALERNAVLAAVISEVNPSMNVKKVVAQATSSK
ncbi:DNA adenine methylase [Runella slithyformis]|uniref:Phage DNA methylase n=1 Tax=Runella slithyformis (strain ATCC 29530 / DSM 19594 / LMG 11500 / NCIMB 11436 / LSU 4) TaxID=761193 RepID=A0A7U3ZI59_RUNSL|nr:DNA adenine methylase [Runella slithyformis]AEI47646.1 phage DNA methylase [Runella slithyformis DSM 19594]